MLQTACAPLLIKALSLGYSYGAELLSPHSPLRPRVISGPVHFSRSLYAAAQVTRRLFFEALISIPFTAVLLNNSVSSVFEGALHRLRGRAVEKTSLRHKRTDSWKQRAFPQLYHGEVLSLEAFSSTWCCRMGKMLDAQSLRASSVSLSSSSLFFFPF